LRVVPVAPMRRLVRADWPLLAALVPAALLRLDAELGYRWQSWFNDSFSYVRAAVLDIPEPQRVSGYPLLLRALTPFHSFALITILQHLTGLLVGVAVYWVARYRFGVRRAVAVLAAVPVLYDGFQIQLEHLIMADVAFEALVVSAVVVLLAAPGRAGPGAHPSTQPSHPSSHPSWRRCAVAGLLLGLACLMRSTGLPLLAVFAVYLFVSRAGSWMTRLRAVVAVVAACALPVLAYAGWYDASRGQYAMTDSTGVFLYSRVMTFADCARMGDLPPSQRALCTTVPAAQRPPAEEYIWRAYSPLIQHDSQPFNPGTNALAKSFAVRAIESQPLDYARVVFDDTARAFDWGRVAYPDTATYDMYLFGTQVTVPTYATARIHGYTSYEAAYARGDPATRASGPFAGWIRGYQRYVWLPGTVFGVLLLIGLAGIVVGWRGPGRHALLPWGMSLGLIVVPAATASFDYRYVLPAVPLACLAAALAFGSGTPGARWLDRLAGIGRPLRVRPGRSGNPAAEPRDDQRDLTPDPS
jgi:Dolichyl-phosphate-mannose-protein mannosyltransferase